MSDQITVQVPDIGDFEGVEVIEVQVEPGDRVAREDSLITLESDKATMEIPSPEAGVVDQVLVKAGDRVSQGDDILCLQVQVQVQVQEPVREAPAAAAQGETPPARGVSQPAPPPGETDLQADVVVLGSGPGGYTAAFRAADLGKSVILVERYAEIGGVCLNVGCIPSKALLHVAQVVNETVALAEHGVVFKGPEIDLAKLAGWKQAVVRRLTGGLAQLAKQRKVRIVQGTGRFASPWHMGVDTAEGIKTIGFEQAIIAAGSQPARLGPFPWEDPRVMDSTAALELETVPGRLLVVGGGIIGLELATVYHALGSRVTVVELTEELIPGCDRDLIRPLSRLIAKRYDNIYLGTRVSAVAAREEGLQVSFEGDKAPGSVVFDRVLVATGRVSNGSEIGADRAGVAMDEHGFIPVDSQQRTNVPHVFAVGDIVGQPMLAHKASHEGKVAAEVCAGRKSHFDARTIPSVAYTDPEVAWMGVTETEAKRRGLEYEKGVFPWAASGRALSLGRDEGMTKLLFDKDRRLIGAGIVGPGAGELIAETVLALEMDADAQDMGLTIHPHPTLSETVSFAAEMAEGTITDLYVPKRGRK
jgi:dihydrolipoamide dehydrogenase